MRVWWLLLVGAAWMLGCGGPSDGGDAAADGAADGSFATSARIPWVDDGGPVIAAPSLVPCPEGWREVELDDLTTCEPYPEGGALDCPPGEAHLPGEPSCAPLGSTCPAGPFSDVLPVDRNVVYVQPGASGDGGGPERPYGSLTGFSLGSLPVGTVIALSSGTHVGPVRLVRGVALWGACAAHTIVTAAEPSDVEDVVTVRSAEAQVRDLTIADSPRPGVWLEDSASVELAGVAVDGELRLAELYPRDQIGPELHQQGGAVPGAARETEEKGDEQLGPRESMVVRTPNIGAASTRRAESRRAAPKLRDLLALREYRSSWWGAAVSASTLWSCPDASSLSPRSSSSRSSSLSPAATTP